MDEGSFPAGIVAGVLVSIVAVLVIVVVVVLFKRRRDNKGNMSRTSGIGANLTPRSSMRVIKKRYGIKRRIDRENRYGK